MSTNSASTETSEWSVLEQHDWDTADQLGVTLYDALDKLGEVDESRVVYDYVDAEAVAAAFGTGPVPAGVDSIRFDCDEHRVRVDADGTIAARPLRSDR